MAMVNIKGLPKEAVLAALYNASRAGGMSVKQVDFTHRMTSRDASRLLGGQTGRISFDYLKGRVMKVDITGSEFDASAYDLRNGVGAGEKAISHVRSALADGGA